MNQTVPIQTPRPTFSPNLPLLARSDDTFDTARYRAAPDDWELVVTDIVDSTLAVADGKHKTVNFVAAMAIAALKNLCAPTRLPFLFGGDGSVVMVPPSHALSARLALARVRGFALREFGMRLRVGICPVARAASVRQRRAWSGASSRRRATALVCFWAAASACWRRRRADAAIRR